MLKAPRLYLHCDVNTRTIKKSGQFEYLNRRMNLKSENTENMLFGTLFKYVVRYFIYLCIFYLSVIFFNCKLMYII